jgi:hypothetical protein
VLEPDGGAVGKLLGDAVGWADVARALFAAWKSGGMVTLARYRTGLGVVRMVSSPAVRVN